MSVINKMLRDLDQRHAGQTGSVGATIPGERATQGALPVNVGQQWPYRPRRQRLGWVGAFLVAILVCGWWFLQAAPSSPPPPLPTLNAVAPSVVAPANVALIKMPAVAAPVASSAAGQVESMVSKALVPEVAAPKVVPKAVEARPVEAPALATGLLPRVQTPVAVVVPEGAIETLRAKGTHMQVGATEKLTPLAAVTRPATLDALAQAQALWNSGSHTAAIELLDQALNRVESATPLGAPVAAQSLLAILARELARMQLADGQVGNASALLKRLEPQLAQVADAWAMRGNAAQRLGQHAEAAQNYQRALALRPDEPRWMLGAAVSLAAQGQIAAAGDWADKARVMGALRPDVANYLRQLGVIIRLD